MKWFNECDVNLEPESGVVAVDEDGRPEDRVESSLKCLPHYDLAGRWNGDQALPFQYWKIRDYAYAYRSRLVTPYLVNSYYFVRSCVYFQLDYTTNIPISICRWQSASSQLSRSLAVRSPRHLYWFHLMLRKLGSKLQLLHKGLRKVMWVVKVFEAYDAICSFFTYKK